MTEKLVELDPSKDEQELEEKVYGVAVAKVISNLDATGEGRVQLSLPWLPGFEPWARVATMMGGMARGTFFIPQVNDEVLVAFHLGDVREPYVVGSLWNTIDRPPALLPTDAVTKRVIRTPLGHEIVFNDLTQELSITSSTQQTITLGLTGIEISAGTLPPPTRARISLDVAGGITIESLVSIDLDAPLVTIKGKDLTLEGELSASLEGGLECTVQGGTVRIN